MAAGCRALVVAAAVVVVAASCVAFAVERFPPMPNGLSFDFYKDSCPQAERIAEDMLTSAVVNDPGLIPALIRMQFHDCSVQGCDGSVLLDNSTQGVSEKVYPPNKTLRPAAFNIINDIHDRIVKECGLVVSCADIITITARDSVKLGGGPRYKVPLGRRDGLKPAPEAVVLAGQPGPTTNVTGLLAVFSTFNLDVVDLVTLLGAHTVGRAECLSFENRLFPTRDPTMSKWFFDFLKLVCPVEGASSEALNDIRTPLKFDNQYYVDLINGVGLFTADQDLFENTTSRPVVAKFSVDQNAFFEQFAFSSVKMGMIDVLTGSQGEIRRNCSVPNAANTSSSSSNLPWSVVETVVHAAENLVL